MKELVRNGGKAVASKVRCACILKRCLCVIKRGNDIILHLVLLSFRLMKKQVLNSVDKLNVKRYIQHNLSLGDELVNVWRLR